MLIIGRVLDDLSGVQWVTSDRRLLELDDIKDQLRFAPRPMDDFAGRWPGDQVMQYLTSASTPSWLDVAVLYHRALADALEFPNPAHVALALTWAMGTYVHRLFRSYPRLLVGGEFESGKSKLLELLAHLCWNAPAWGIPTTAPVFRTIHEWRPTLLLDEMEHLDRDDLPNLVGILNAGYKRTLRVPRVEGDKHRRTETYEVYSPVALAGIRGANLVTTSRCLPITLLRAADPTKLDFEIDDANPLYVEARSLMHWVLLGRWQEVRAHYAEVELPDWLHGRPRELWKPLLVMADLIDRANPRAVAIPSLRPALVGLAREHVESRETVRPEIAALVEVLADKLTGASQLEVSAKDLIQPLQDALGSPHPPTAQRIGTWLRQLGFARQRDRRAKYHVVDRLTLEAFARRYGLTISS